MTHPSGYNYKFTEELPEYEPAYEPGYSNGNGNGHKPANKQRASNNGRSKSEEPIQPLVTFDFADLLKEDFPPLQWIIPDILPEGLTLLFARPKIGKSMFALALSLRIARRVSGGIDGTVLYLTLDDTSKRRLQDRTRDLLQGLELESGRVHGAIKADSLDTGLAEQLTMWMNVHSDTRLIVIDVYARVKPKKKTDDVFKGDYDALIQLQEFAVRYHCAIILIHHTRKQVDTQDWINNVNGSTGLLAAPDTIWSLKRARGSGAMKLEVTGRDIRDESTISITLDDLDETWEASPEEPEAGNELKEIEEKVLIALQDAGRALYPREIAKAIGAKSVRMAMRRMLKKKLLSQVMPYGPYISSLHLLQLSSDGASQAALDESCNKSVLQLSSDGASQAALDESCNAVTGEDRDVVFDLETTQSEEPVSASQEAQEPGNLATLEPVIDSFLTASELARASQEARKPGSQEEPVTFGSLNVPPKHCSGCGKRARMILIDATSNTPYQCEACGTMNTGMYLQRV